MEELNTQTNHLISKRAEWDELLLWLNYNMLILRCREYRWDCWLNEFNDSRTRWHNKMKENKLSSEKKKKRFHKNDKNVKAQIIKKRISHFVSSRHTKTSNSKMIHCHERHTWSIFFRPILFKPHSSYHLKKHSSVRKNHWIRN